MNVLSETTKFLSYSDCCTSYESERWVGVIIAAVPGVVGPDCELQRRWLP